MFTFEEAKQRLESVSKEKLGAGTYLVRVDSSTFGIKYNGIIIVYIFESGIYQLDTASWKTEKIRKKMNEYAPAFIYIENDLWLLREKVFYDGIRIDSDGNLIDELRNNS